VLRLTPLALLGGKVIDESGDPVRNARLMLYVENNQAGMNRITPAGRRFDRRSGFLRVCGSGSGITTCPSQQDRGMRAPCFFSPEGAGNSPRGVARSLDVAYPTTYYNGATDADAATPIPIKGGDQLQADIPLNPVPALHLVIHVPNDGQQGFMHAVFQNVFRSE